MWNRSRFFIEIDETEVYFMEFVPGVERWTNSMREAMLFWSKEEAQEFIDEHLKHRKGAHVKDVSDKLIL